MNKTTSCRHELQKVSVETSVTKSTPSTWRKRPDNLHEHIDDAKLRDFYVSLQRYVIAGEAFCRGMEKIAAELGLSKRTVQRRFDELERRGLVHRQARRAARNRNLHNRITVVKIDDLFVGIRLSSRGCKFVTGYYKETSSTKAGTRARRAAPIAPKVQKPVPPSSRGMRHQERQRAPVQVDRFARWREWTQRGAYRGPDASVGMQKPAPYVEGIAGMNGKILPNDPLPNAAELEAVRRRIREREEQVRAEQERIQAEKRARIAAMAARQAEARQPWDDDQKAQAAAMWAKYFPGGVR